MGGGTLTIPLLTIFLSYEQLQAQGVNLIAFLPMSLVALWIHIKNHLVDFKNTWLLAVIGCVFSLNLKERLDGFRKALEFLKRSFGILIMTDSYRHFVC
jgi:hypothetical protein